MSFDTTDFISCHPYMEMILRLLAPSPAPPKSSLDKFVKLLQEKYELKEAARLGPALEDHKKARVLYRIIR